MVKSQTLFFRPLIKQSDKHGNDKYNKNNVKQIDIKAEKVKSNTVIYIRHQIGNKAKK